MEERSKEFDLITVGDATWDVFITPSESETVCKIDDKECLLCLSYGDKIPVKSIEFSIGGNAANVAVGVSRLGISVAPVLTLGDDTTGDKIVEKFESEGVDTKYISRQENSETNYYTIIVVSGERTILGYKVPRDYMFPAELPKTKWMYLTSMGENFQPTYQKVVEHMKKNQGIKLAFNPGSRQLRAGTDTFREVLSVSHVVYINRQEAEMITGMENTQGKEKDLLQALAKLGPKIPIVTDGVNGSFVYDGEKFYRAGILPIDSYERTGAGDSFGSGCISALIKGKPFTEALLWGTVNSASVIGYAGAQRGLLTEEALPEWLERAKSSRVEVEEL